MKRFENNTFFKKLFVGWIVPANRSLGIRLKSVDGKKITMSLKKCRKNTNYGGTVHGAAMMALGETIHGMGVLQQIGTFDHMMVSKNTNMAFLKKGKGELQVAFELDSSTEDFIKEELSKNDKCIVNLTAEIKDTEGDVISILSADYHIRKLRK
jgi:uncharacterized protein DUF4442